MRENRTLLLRGWKQNASSVVISFVSESDLHLLLSWGVCLFRSVGRCVFCWLNRLHHFCLLAAWRLLFVGDVAGFVPFGVILCDKKKIFLCEERAQPK